MFTCTTCLQSFDQRNALLRHRRVHHSNKSLLIHRCENCGQTFSREYSLQRHIHRSHRGDKYLCSECGRPFKTQRDLKAHDNQVHASSTIQRYHLRPPKSDTFKYTSINSVMGGAMEVVRLSPINEIPRDPFLYKRKSFHIISFLIKNAVDQHKAVKWHLRLNCEFVKSTDIHEKFVMTFNSPVQIALLRDPLSIRKSISDTFDFLVRAIDIFEERGSGWELNTCGNFCDVYLGRYRPLRASSYIPLPDWLARPKFILNINNDNRQDCFTLCVLASLFPQDRDGSLPSKYDKYFGQIDCSMLKYPVSLEQIGGFENSNNLRIDVYGVDGNELVPLRISKVVEDWRVVTLLFLERGHKQHYCLIKDLDIFMRTSHHATYVCRKCLLSFNTRYTRDRHTKQCISEHQVHQLPTTDNVIVKFEQICNMLRVPMSFVGDIETLIKPIHGAQPNPKQSFSLQTAQHEVMLATARGVFQCCGIDTREYLELPIYDGLDAVVEMIKRIIDYGMDYQEKINFLKKPINMSSEDWHSFNNTNRCEICQKSFDLVKKCRDHCAFCSKYRMALCDLCNFDYRITRNVHVYMHNFSGFDSTFVAPALAKIARERNYEIDCLARSGDSFISIKMEIPFKNKKGESKIWRLRFFDSMSFLPSSLSVLTDSLRKEGEDKFHATRDTFGLNSRLLMEKQIIPYTYFDDESKLKELQLPPISAFRNDLSGEDLDEESYQHARMVWNKMECQTLFDYYCIYLKCDVNLLLDVWENYRAFTMKHYKLDAARYVTGPALSYSAMLLMTKVELELVQDIEMWEMITQGIRGGLSVVSSRLEFSNDGEEPDLPLNKLFFVDAVNLYGWSMQQPLAQGEYQWVSREEVDKFDVFDYPFDHPVGYLIECDLTYPDELHDAHDSNPLAPELMVVDDEQLSDYQRSLVSSPVGKVPKLVAHLGPRVKYVLDYRNLQLYLNLGMKLSSVHRILSFKQRSWMEPYISFNTRMRQNAVSDFQKLLFKLMNNACFGKQLEDPCKYRETQICINEKQLEKLIKKPNYVGAIVYKEFICVTLRPLKVKLNKMRIVGCQITDLAKHKMQDYYYNCLYPAFGSSLKLCVHDTDSYLVAIKNEPYFYVKLKELVKWHDFSTLPCDHPCYDISHKGVPGYMAPECNGKKITGVAAIRAKCYAIQFHDGKEKKRIKGISKIVRDRKLRFDNYVNCLTKNYNRRDVVTMLRKYQGDMYTLRVNKCSLVNYDDKRHLIDSLTSYAHGNCNIPM